MKTCLLVLLVVISGTQIARTADNSVTRVAVGRSTNDRMADLVGALIRVGRWDDALQFCDQQSKRLDPKSDLAAKWAIRKSQVLTALAMTGHDFGESETVAAQQPIVELRKAYPDHQRILFLRAQQVRVDKAAATHRVVKASISSSDQAKQNAAEHSVRVTANVRELLQDIADARASLDRLQNATAGMDEDLNRLQQELSVDAVSLSLVQTELFGPGSVDRIAAATNAEQAADEAIRRIPAGSLARIEIQRLRVQAILRAGQIKRAASEFELLRELNDQPATPALLALHIQISLAQGNRQQAESLLSDYYQDSPLQAPESLEMDIARLEYLLLHQNDQIAAWFDAIAQRGGDYAQRRAESIALFRVGQTATASKVNPELLAIQGRAWLRKGDPVRAGELLSVSASADDNSERTLRHASEAAAAFVSAGQNAAAAKCLTDTALAHQQNKAAAAVHLQAVLLRSAEPQPTEQQLRKHLKTWSTGTVARDARRWLHKLLADQGRFTEAAIVVSDLGTADVDEEQLERIAAAWRDAFHQSDDSSLSQPSQEFRDALRTLLKSPAIQTRYRAIASMLLNRDSLAGLPEGSPPDPFIDAFIQFRLAGTVTPNLKSVPDEFARDARWRLMRDGRQLPQLRPPSPHCYKLGIWN